MPDTPFDRTTIVHERVDANSAAHAAWGSLFDAPMRRLAAFLARQRRRRELACIEPRLMADAGLDAERYLRR